MLTLRYLRYWHTRYNRLIFDGSLGQPKFTIKKLRGKEGGWCVASDPIEIIIMSGQPMEYIRRILIHEMVHQWQLEQGKPLGHGPSFQEWDSVCLSKTGLPLWQ